MQTQQVRRASTNGQENAETTDQWSDLKETTDQTKKDKQEFKNIKNYEIVNSHLILV